MKKYKAILFDMDGTLIPMDVHAFSEGYFHDLHEKISEYNFEHEFLVKCIWKGTGAMVVNDGSRINCDVFWDVFGKLLGKDEPTMARIQELCDDFYGNEFDKAKRFTQDNPLAKEAVSIAHKKADKVILATNPLFPMKGQYTRMNWVDLCPEDFDMITAYETDSYCKPNPAYFTSVCERNGLNPSECLMVGNDEDEDMYAASSIGMDCYLITDSQILSKEHPWNGKKGTFKEFLEFLKGLPE